RRIGDHAQVPALPRPAAGGWVRIQARAHAELLLDLLLDLVGQVGVVAQEGAGVLLALPQLVALVGVPGAGLAHDPLLDPQVDQAAPPADPEAEKNIKSRTAERRSALVLAALDPGTAADRIGAVLEGLDPPHVQPDRGVELERPPAAGRLRAVVDHDTVDEVAVRPLHFDVEAVHGPQRGLDVDAEDPCGREPTLGFGELRLDGEAAPEPP